MKGARARAALAIAAAAALALPASHAGANALPGPAGPPGGAPPSSAPTPTRLGPDASTAAAAPSTAAASSSPPDDDGAPRLSLPTEAERETWKRSGFRLGIGLVYGRFEGLSGAPSGRLLGTTLRLGLRLDASWSVMASFQYAGASAAGGLSALRFAGTLDPTWHVTRNLALAIGFGFGGIVETSSSRPDIDPLPSTLNSSYTLPSASPPLPTCSGVGAAGLVRAEWSMALGPRTAFNLALEVLGQRTGCIADTGRVEPDTGQAIVRRQFWTHAGVTLGGGFTWR